MRNFYAEIKVNRLDSTTISLKLIFELLKQCKQLNKEDLLHLWSKSSLLTDSVNTTAFLFRARIRKRPSRAVIVQTVFLRADFVAELYRVLN